jgi:hypothetical protein
MSSERPSTQVMNAFTAEIRAAFYVFQTEYDYSYRFASNKAIEVNKWLLDPKRKPHLQEDQSFRNWTLKNFALDINGEHGTYKSAIHITDKIPIWLKCIGPGDVFRIVAEEHEANSHAGYRKVFDSFIRNQYYGISRKEV